MNSKILSPDQWNKTPNPKKKWRWWYTAIIFTVFLNIITRLPSCSTDSKSISSDNKLRPKSDSVTEITKEDLFKKIKSEQAYKVKDINLTADSILQIAVSNPAGSITANLFDEKYHLNDISYIDQVDVFKYKKNKTFAKGNYTDPEGSVGKKIARFNEAFKKQFISGWDGTCRPLEKTVKNSLKDPDSYQHIKTTYGYWKDGLFNVEMSYRAKNSFGGYVVNTVEASINKDGDIINMNSLNE